MPIDTGFSITPIDTATRQRASFVGPQHLASNSVRDPAASGKLLPLAGEALQASREVPLDQILKDLNDHVQNLKRNLRFYVDEATGRSAERDGKIWYFCGAGCEKRFLSGESAATAPHPPGASGARYYCPMCPEVASDEPASCPVCGMELLLNPAFDPSAPEDDSALRAMTRRLWVAAALPLLALPPLVLMRRVRRRLIGNARRQARCLECGYHLLGVWSSCCPECGTTRFDVGQMQPDEAPHTATT